MSRGSFLFLRHLNIICPGFVRVGPSTFKRPRPLTRPGKGERKCFPNTVDFCRRMRHNIFHGRVVQWENACLTRKRSLVRYQSRPPGNISPSGLFVLCHYRFYAMKRKSPGSQNPATLLVERFKFCKKPAPH